MNLSISPTPGARRPVARALLVSLMLAGAVLAGCSSVPPRNSQLDAARSDYQRAQASSQVTEYASVELRLASDTLDRGNRSLNAGDTVQTVDNFAYLAKQQVAIAQETASRKASEVAVANASAARDKLRLESRTIEAETARARAASAQASADQATASAELSQRQNDEAQRKLLAEQGRSDDLQRATDAALLQAQNAQSNAAAANQQAENAEARANRLEAQLGDMNAKQTKRGMVITLGDVLFDNNVSQLKRGSERNLQKLANFSSQNPGRKMAIEGYADSVGTDGSNQVLSEKRAQSVYTALMTMGVAADRMSARGYGEEYPVASNDDATGRQLNRRVEIVISNDNGVISAR